MYKYITLDQILKSLISGSDWEEVVFHIWGGSLTYITFILNLMFYCILAQQILICILLRKIYNMPGKSRHAQTSKVSVATKCHVCCHQILTVIWPEIDTWHLLFIFFIFCETQIPPITINSKGGKVLRTKTLIQVQRPCHKNVHVRYKSSNIYYLVMNNVFFLNSRSKV